LIILFPRVKRGEYQDKDYSAWVGGIREIYFVVKSTDIRFNLPMVVITVQAKNRDCPKLQFGSPETFLAAETPLLLADNTSFIKFSIESSEKKYRLIK